MSTHSDTTPADLATPTIPGLTFRPFAGEADLHRIVDLQRASKEADRMDITPTFEGLASYYLHTPTFDPYRDARLAEIAGETVAHSWLEHIVEPAGAERYVHNVIVRLDWRGKGIGRMLLRLNEQIGREKAAAKPDAGQRWYEIWSWEAPNGADELLRQEGYVPVGYFFQMVRDLTEPIPELPLPPGFEVRPVHPDDYHRVWLASETAMLDHWGAQQVEPAHYERYATSPYFQPHLWQVAWVDGEVAGSVLGFVLEAENMEYGRRRGYTENISVGRTWRRRGVASALIARSLQMFKKIGMTEAALRVDTENLSGALHLYERLGYCPVRRNTAYRKPLVR